MLPTPESTPMPRDPQDDAPLLTFAQVAQWRERLLHLKMDRARIDTEVQDLEGKLKAAEMFMPSAPPMAAGPVAPPSMRQMMLEVLTLAGRPLTPREIREAAAKAHPEMAPKLKSSSAYPYMMLTKLLEQGLLEKANERYSLTKK